MTGLEGYAAVNLTLKQLQALTWQMGANPAGFTKALGTLAAELGVSGAELINSIKTTTTVSGEIGSLARTAVALVSEHGVTTAAVDVAAAEATAAGVGAASAGGGAAAGGISATTIAAGALIAIGAAIVGYTGYTAFQANSANNEADRAEQVASDTEAAAETARVDREIENMNREEVFSAGAGYVVVQVSNHSQKALSVLSREQVQNHYDGETTLKLCDFLHGGRCGGDVVDTPNGPVTIADSPTAVLSEIRDVETRAAGWQAICSVVSGVTANRLAEGFSAEYGGDRVTLDYRGIRAPC